MGTPGDVIRELLDLHAGAIEAEEGTPTAQKLGPYKPNVVFKLGRLVITSVSLKDDGLRGADKDVNLGVLTEYVGDPASAKAMEGLGLPTGFGEDGLEKVKVACMTHGNWLLPIYHAVCTHDAIRHACCLHGASIHSYHSLTPHSRREFHLRWLSASRRRRQHPKWQRQVEIIRIG